MIKGTPPTPRDSHSCTTVGDNLFVFGGTDGMNPLKDLHILDTCEAIVSFFHLFMLARAQGSMKKIPLPFSLVDLIFLIPSFTYVDISKYKR